jgi:hypothetical protein
MAIEISAKTLGITSLGTLDKNKAAMQTGQLVKAQHYDEARTFLRSLDSEATVRIVNGRSKSADLTLSTQSNKGNFYSRKPVTTEFFKQACIAKFSNNGNRAAVEQAFDETYQAETLGKSINSAGHFQAVMAALESKFTNQDVGLMPMAPVLPGEVDERPNVSDQIRSLAAQLPTHEGQGHDPKVRDQLISLLKTGVAESVSSRADFLREHLDTLTSLFYFEITHNLVLDDEVVADLNSLRNERDEIPEFAKIKLMLVAIDLEYTGEYGVTGPMPWYLLRGNDGSIAALDHPSYSQLQLGAPNDKLMESVQIFNVHQGKATLINSTELKQIGAAIVDLYPPLHAYFNAPRVASASAELAQQLFKDDLEVNSWLQLAMKGVRQELSDLQKVQLGGAFMKGAQTMLEDLSLLDTPARWPEAKLNDEFLADLRQQASDTSQVAPNDERAFARFLFALSATITRLSSQASLGDDDNSIPQLRFLGYVLSHTAQTLQPELLADDQWGDVNKAFLDRNACAELLSRLQLKISKSMEPDEFVRFVPQVYHSAAS